ncbi:hypothetical protein J8273_6336 [Carpediemonas membranifera]|uniref:Uncharacterized protein n=1 Tax=Carpediemonas membranifera TaxID=201153 RepID=A0A8J6E0B0_9EUKA|nr:hypothetical protein J8273_6336 [Carpediemonas membranifera]|eukprot:KAG9391571.1 hypothetical protein J8273_6336 [Carpediemonas membranifera]
MELPARTFRRNNSSAQTSFSKLVYTSSSKPVAYDSNKLICVEDPLEQSLAATTIQVPSTFPVVSHCDFNLCNRPSSSDRSKTGPSSGIQKRARRKSTPGQRVREPCSPESQLVFSDTETLHQTDLLCKEKEVESIHTNAYTNHLSVE